MSRWISLKKSNLYKHFLVLEPCKNKVHKLKNPISAAHYLLETLSRCVITNTFTKSNNRKEIIWIVDTRVREQNSHSYSTMKEP